MTRPTADELIQHLNLVPLPVEGGLFRQTWRGAPEVIHPQTGRSVPSGTVIYGLLTTDPDSFSALHRLPTTEVWHFYLGDPIQLLLLHPDGSAAAPLLGHDILGGQHVQLIVPAGTWMGARLHAGGSYGLFGTSMAPGFTEADYEGGDATLADAYPAVAAKVLGLLRSGSQTQMEAPEAHSPQRAQRSQRSS